MSHGVHAVQHEAEHRLEHGHADTGGHETAVPQSRNKQIALLIAVLALFLSLSETLGKSAQTRGIDFNIKASDTWNFFQAKTVRQTTLRTAAEALASGLGAQSDEAVRSAMTKQIDGWNAIVKRYESDPQQKDGRKELRALAEQYEHDRDIAMARYHSYEFGSAAYQIGIVLASAAVITGALALAYCAAGLGVVGVIFTALALFAPNVAHDGLHWFEHLFSAAGAH